MNKFDKRKKDILSKLDKSNKNEWDKKISSLCNKINAFDEYYTTSSCSGRIVLMISQDKKEKKLFIFVYHNKISLKKLKEGLNFALKTGKKIKFKFEPCILHVACRTIEDAQRLYYKAKSAGWKKSGIIGMKNGFIVELNGTEKLEFPVIQNKKILVSDEFLKVVVEESNKKFEKSWNRIKKLENQLNFQK